MQNKLYVGNLPYTTKDEDLKKLFEECGEVVEAKVITDKFRENRSKGFGFVTMKDDETAKKAQETMNGKDIEGRKLRVDIARPMRDKE